MFTSAPSRRFTCRTTVARLGTVRGGNLPFGDFTSILINPRNGDEIFVGNAYQIGEIGGGVYRTTNGGTNMGAHRSQRTAFAEPENLGAGV